MGANRLAWCATVLTLSLLAGCAAPKDSYKQFSQPKYKIREHARDGMPAVSQTWWKSLWFWQRTGQKSRNGSAIRLR